MEHGIFHFLLPSPLDRFPFLLSNLELAIEGLSSLVSILEKNESVQEEFKDFKSGHAFFL
jgi:hypothetical protein